MANPDASFGLRPIRNGGNGANPNMLRKMVALSTYGTALFPGDPVLVTGTSQLGPDGLIVPVCQRAGTSGYISGVIEAVIPETDDALRHRAASTERYLLVNVDPYQLFEIQVDGALAVTDVSNTADLIFTNAGSAVTGQSGAELDCSDIGSGTQLVIEGVRDQDRNDLTGSNAVAIVRINLHQSRYTTGV